MKFTRALFTKQFPQFHEVVLIATDGEKLFKIFGHIDDKQGSTSHCQKN